MPLVFLINRYVAPKPSEVKFIANVFIASFRVQISFQLHSIIIKIIQNSPVFERIILKPKLDNNNNNNNKNVI